MSEKEAIQRWVESAQEDLHVARDLYAAKRYAYTLFFCHLTLEKYLKALYIHRFDDAPPPIHDVLFLWKKLQLPMTEEKESDLVEIKTFNVEARYDIHKHMLYKKATEGYTKSFMEKIEAMILLIEKEL